MPLATMKPLSQSAAVSDLGLGGQLSQQVSDLSDEERKKRMLEMQRQKQGLPGPSAVTSLFGSGLGAGY